MKKKIFYTLSILFFAAFNLSAQSSFQKESALNLETNLEPVKFEFKYNTGDRYRILSTVNEEVYYNRTYSHHAVIINRVSAEITGVTKDGAGVHDAVFMTTEDSSDAYTNAHFNYGEEYHSVFTRSVDGTYSISDEYFMPTVRDVPKFPQKAILPGEKWSAEGHEAHDLRKNFNVQKPYKVPFTANYTYLGREKETGLYVFKVKYTMEMETPQKKSAGSGLYYDEEYPSGMMGFSDETIFWDAEKGAISSYSETFRILMSTSYGNILEFRGNAHAEVTDFYKTSTKENVDLVQKKIDDLGLENISVKEGEKGLTLSVENIKFKPDSAELLESEKEKLKQIAEILKQWPNNDILVSGHTALAGTAKTRQKLSEQRAQAVADYLVKLGVKDSYHIFTQGFGASKPIATNSTEEGKSKNRRVEITIMDK